jgi:hypothetical protein
MDPQSYTPELMWINHSETGTQSHARAHVVRERRRRASWDEKKVMETLQKRSQNERITSHDASASPDATDKQFDLAPGYSEFLGGGRRDPFAMYPVELTINMQELLDHCKL